MSNVGWVEIFKLIIIRQRLALIAGLVGLLLGSLYAVNLPNLYKSECKILSEEPKRNGGLGTASAMAASFGITLPGSNGEEFAYLEVLKSRWLGELVLKKRYEFRLSQSIFSKKTAVHQTLLDYLGTNSLDRGLSGLAQIAKCQKDKTEKLLIISVTTRSPELSCQVAGEMARLLEFYLKEKSQTRGGLKVAFLDARMKEAETSLLDSEDRMRGFLSLNRGFRQSLDGVVRIQGERLEQELALRRQILTSLSLSREQALTEEKDDLPVLNILDVANLPEQKVGPNRKLISGVFGFLFFLGALIVSNHKQIAQFVSRLKLLEEQADDARLR